MNVKAATSSFTKKLDSMIGKIKTNEDRRKKYINNYAVKMDAKREGIKENI